MPRPPNMSRNTTLHLEMVENAARFLTRAPQVTVPEAMHVGRFSEDDIADPNIQKKSSDTSLAARYRWHHQSLWRPCLRSPVVSGYNGIALKGTIIPIKATEVITMTHTQERIDLLAQGEATQQPASTTSRRDERMTMSGQEGGAIRG